MMPIFTDFIWPVPDLFLQRQQTAPEGSISPLSGRDGRVGAASVPAFKSSHRESFLCRGHSLWITRQIQAPKAAAFAKLAYPITPELPSLERISGWRRAKATSLLPSQPARGAGVLPSHRGSPARDKGI